MYGVFKSGTTFYNSFSFSEIPLLATETPFLFVWKNMAFVFKSDPMSLEITSNPTFLYLFGADSFHKMVCFIMLIALLIFSKRTTFLQEKKQVCTKEIFIVVS